MSLRTAAYAELINVSPHGGGGVGFIVTEMMNVEINERRLPTWSDANLI